MTTRRFRTIELKCPNCQYACGTVQAPSSVPTTRKCDYCKALWQFRVDFQWENQHRYSYLVRAVRADVLAKGA